MKQTPASAQNYAVRGRRSRCVRFLRRGRVNTTAEQGSRRSPATAGSVGRGRATEWTSLPACGEARDASSARTTASIAFVWSAAMPLPAFRTHSGQKPGPTSEQSPLYSEHPAGEGIPSAVPLLLSSKRNPLRLAFVWVKKTILFWRNNHEKERYQV